jgi:hypothetical protein
MFNPNLWNMKIIISIIEPQYLSLSRLSCLLKLKFPIRKKKGLLSVFFVSPNQEPILRSCVTYNATVSLVRFENKNISFTMKNAAPLKCSSLLQRGRWNCILKFLRIGSRINLGTPWKICTFNMYIPAYEIWAHKERLNRSRFTCQFKGSLSDRQ